MDRSVIILNHYRADWCPFLVVVQIFMLLLAVNELALLWMLSSSSQVPEINTMVIYEKCKRKMLG